jgi:hypothetical protein
MFLSAAVRDVIMQKKCVTVVLLRACRPAELLVNMLKDVI